MTTSSNKTVSNLARPSISTDDRNDHHAEKNLNFIADSKDEEEKEGEDYFFSNLGSAQERKKRKVEEDTEKPDPEKLKISKNELNHQLVEGRKIDEYQVPGKRSFLRNSMHPLHISPTELTDFFHYNRLPSHLISCD